MSEVKKIATRASYGAALVELGKEHEDLVVLDADLAAATQTGMFKKEFPERHIDCGIAECNMMGIAAGLATTGKVPFASTFAMFAAGRAYEQLRNSVAMCDSNGYIHDPNGINLDIVKDIKEVKRGRIKEYADRVEGATYTEGVGIWNIKCDVYLPCATQNELDLDGVKTLIANGCKYIVEGANMPTTREATDYAMANGVLFLPGKASNAGGVATSALEMSQNSQRLSWTSEEVDAKLHQIMVDIYAKISDAAKRYDMPDNFVVGANIAGFEKVVDAMMAQGIV